MTSDTSFPTKLKDPRTCRIFFSSPFGGMEEEREELTRKYFPQIHHLCNSRGIQFVPVDMRWGITSEAAENAQTVNICLRELDRCDIFVGFYGQRYGWHGSEDKLFQQNLDNATARYPWVNEYRDRSATELEFIHGHLNNPGALPACFCFRDKKYDEDKASMYEKAGDLKMASKYQGESKEASLRLTQLQTQVENTQHQTLSVHSNYKSPEEAAWFMSESILAHLEKVLLVEDEEIPEHVQEKSDHDAFMASRQALYVGGQKYFDQLDPMFDSDENNRTVVIGLRPGQGKSALLANWLPHVRHAHPDAILAYHFVGASKASGEKGNILKRLIADIEEVLPNTEEKPEDIKTDNNETDFKENKDKTEKETDCKEGEENNKDKDDTVIEKIDTDNKKDTDESDKKIDNLDGNEKKGDDSKDDGDEKKKDYSEEKEKEGEKDKSEEKKDKAKKLDVKELMKKFQELLEKAEKAGRLVVIVIDGLNKLLTGGKVAKPLFWLPNTFPKNVKIVVSTTDPDDKKRTMEKLARKGSVLKPELKTELDQDEEVIVALSERGYDKVRLEDLQPEHKTEICLKLLEKAGKALSESQLQKIVHKDQTSNPLFLKILLAELSVFGSFRKLDEKIDHLLQSESVEDLCSRFLERLESDYNTQDCPHLVQSVLGGIEVSHEGMSETELIEMLDVPTHVWSPLFFALEQFIVIHSGFISFAFKELSDAIKERYLQPWEKRVEVTQVSIKFFDEKRKAFNIWPKPHSSSLKRPAHELSWLQKKIDDKEGLTRTLSDLLVFQTLIIDCEYELFELWKSTGHSFTDIADIYIRAFDEGLVYVYTLEKEKLYTNSDSKKPPGQRLLFYLENLRFLMDMASCNPGSSKICERIIKLLENLENVWEGNDRMTMLMEHKYYLACNCCDVGRYDEAEENHNKCIQYWKETLEQKAGESKSVLETIEQRLAWTYNGLGLVNYHRQKYEDAEKLFKDSLEMHMRHKAIRNAADSWTNIGLVYIGMKNYPRAIECFDESLKLYEEHYFDSVPHVIGNLYTNMGLAYRRSNKLTQAETYYFKSLELKAKAVGWEHPIIATAYMNLGTLETVRKNYSKVEEYTQKALHIHKVNQFDYEGREYRQCRENMANCYIKMNDYEKAEPYFWSVFDVLTKKGLLRECLPTVHTNMAKFYIDKADYEKADRILTALARCPEKRRATTFHYLALLDDTRAKAGIEFPTRDEDLTLEQGLKLFQYNEALVKYKLMERHIKKGDIEGAVEYLASFEAEAGDYITCATWCKEEQKVGIAIEVLDHALKMNFPDGDVLKEHLAMAWYENKHEDKAIAYLRQLPDDKYEDTTHVTAAELFLKYDEKDLAKRWYDRLRGWPYKPSSLTERVNDLASKLKEPETDDKTEKQSEETEKTP